MPAHPLPPPLRGAERGTFTEYSIVTRLPEIARRTLAENDFAADAAARIEALIAEIPDGRIRPLTAGTAWNRYVTPYEGETWLTAPWFFVETYFYRRILAACGYFGPGPGEGVDPFARQKRQGLTSSAAETAALARRWQTAVDAGGAVPLTDFLAAALWGNQADLSLWPAERGGQPGHADGAQQDAHLLADDRQAALAHLTAAAAPQVVVLLDNAGFELVADLALAAALLAANAAAVVTLHAKVHPTFVSDAMVADVRQTVGALRAADDAAVRALGEALAGWERDGRLRLRDHPFWTSPLPAWQLPDDLRAWLGAARLVISKGDANYRRLLGDRHWPWTTPLAAIVDSFPAPLLALRTLKSEVVAGLAETAVARAQRQDADWMTNGKWGMNQFTSLLRQPGSEL
ncbi:MAG: protein-glutamate O-methyltransferase family protein [Anaerolineales bacterium]|nr:protein-glutamate O-methyltransferase family protein [Anaerolineales bacterium]